MDMLAFSQLSIIIPTFNEERRIEKTLLQVQACAPNAEIIVVEGRSNDKTVAIASKHARVIAATLAHQVL